MGDKKEPMFSAKNLRLITNPLSKANPTTVLVLGICPVLGVTVEVMPAIVMSISILVVLAASNVIVSLLRNTIPPSIRIIVQLVIVAALVILVDQVLKAYVFEVSKQLSVFVGLIITNCILMGRLEAFAMGNKPWASFLDGIGNALGFSAVLIILSSIRELFGSGTLLGFPILEPLGFYNIGYENNGLMILPPMALIVMGLLVWIHRSFNKELIDK